MKTFKPFAFTFLFFFFTSSLFGQNDKPTDKALINDVSRLNPTYVSGIIQAKDNESIKKVFSEAKERGLKFSIAAKRHSQGGHIAHENAIVLDMSTYNQILNLDEKDKVLTVQSGTTWAQIQEFIN